MCFFPYNILIAMMSFWAIAAQGTPLADALLKAGCIAKCSDDFCLENCNHHPESSKNLPMLPEDAKADATLHCRDFNLMIIKHNPGVFVIEWTNTEGVWTNATVSNGSLVTFADLTTGTPYQYRLHRVTGEGVSRPETTPWFSTIEADHKPENVTNISLESLKMDEHSDRFWAEISFSPAEDRVCYYELVYWERSGPSPIVTEELREREEFQITMKDLDYGKNYSVGIMALTWDGRNESGRVWSYFLTPACLDYHKNLMVCAPRPVEGLQVKEVVKRGKLMDFTVTWDAPDWIPDNYSLMIVPWEPAGNISRIFLPGNETEAVVSVASIGYQIYDVRIQAFSAGGVSPETSLQQEIGLVNMQNPPINSRFKGVVIVVVLTTVTLVMFGIGGICTYHQIVKRKRYRRRCKYFESLDQKDRVLGTVMDVLKADLAIGTDEPLAVTDEYEIRPDRLQIKEILGSGAFGIVRLGTLRGEHGQVIDVAIKMPRTDPNGDNIRSFQQEVLMMKSVGQHPNIVSLIGCCTSGCDPLLVVEYCSRGDLQTYLRTIWENMTTRMLEPGRLSDGICPPVEDSAYSMLQATSSEIAEPRIGNVIVNRLYDIDQEFLHNVETVTAADLLNFARQIAIGMEFLSSNRIVHRDLAARNVLVCADKTVKISDFGLSRDIYQENVYKKQGNGRVPIKWMAIESLTHQIYSTHSDVWSFGILLWEIVTLGSSPYPDTPTNRVLTLLKSGYRMERPRNCGTQLYNLMLSCWCGKPRERPTFTKLRQELDRLLCTVAQNQYLDLSDVLREYVNGTGPPRGTESQGSSSPGSHEYLTGVKYANMGRSPGDYEPVILAANYEPHD